MFLSLPAILCTFMENVQKCATYWKIGTHGHDSSLKVKTKNKKINIIVKPPATSLHSDFKKYLYRKERFKVNFNYTALYSINAVLLYELCLCTTEIKCFKYVRVLCTNTQTPQKSFHLN